VAAALGKFLGYSVPLVETQRQASPRALVVVNKLTTGGAERHLSQILPELRARGLEIELFVLERGGDLEAALAASGVPISGPLRRFGRAMHLLVAALVLYREIRTKRPDVLHFFLPESYLVGGIVAAAAGHRICLMSRRSLSHYHRIHPWLAWVERRLHRRMSALLGNSQAVVHELVDETGDRDKIGLIHNGVALSPPIDERSRALQRARLDLPTDAFVMVIVANLIHYKGHFDLLDALGLVATNLPQPWRLVVVGRDEGIGTQLKLKAERLNLNPNILWLGARGDVEAILPAADLGLLVSHQEGFSNALIEMMGQGLPTIATAIGGNLDAVVDGQSGRLVPVKDSARLGEAILELALDPSARGALGLAARKRTIALFSMTGCVTRYERLYRGFRELTHRPVQPIIDGIDLAGTSAI
jgi:glycosyltransferase involved in cell wall biosynthesis